MNWELRFALFYQTFNAKDALQDHLWLLLKPRDGSSSEYLRPIFLDHEVVRISNILFLNGTVLLK